MERDDLIYPDLSYEIVGCAFEVHNEIGPGHPEKYYHRALAEIFDEKGIEYSLEKYMSVEFKDKTVGKQFLDFLVENKIAVEIGTPELEPASI